METAYVLYDETGITSTIKSIIQDHLDELERIYFTIANVYIDGQLTWMVLTNKQLLWFYYPLHIFSGNQAVVLQLPKQEIISVKVLVHKHKILIESIWGQFEVLLDDSRNTLIDLERISPQLESFCSNSLTRRYDKGIIANTRYTSIGVNLWNGNSKFSNS